MSCFSRSLSWRKELARKVRGIKCDYICKISTHDLVCFPLSKRLLRLLATLYWPAVEMQYGGVSVWGNGYGYVKVMSYHISNSLRGKLAQIQYFVTKGQMLR